MLNRFFSVVFHVFTFNKRIPYKETDAKMESSEPQGQKEETFAANFMKKAENVEMTDNDVEIAENNGADFKHDSLMEYSNIQLDFIKVFGKKVFVMVIGWF